MYNLCSHSMLLFLEFEQYKLKNAEQPSGSVLLMDFIRYNCLYLIGKLNLIYNFHLNNIILGRNMNIVRINKSSLKNKNDYHSVSCRQLGDRSCWGHLGGIGDKKKWTPGCYSLIYHTSVRIQTILGSI